VNTVCNNLVVSYLHNMASSTTVRVATAQFYSHTDVPANLQLCVSYMKEAVSHGARLVVFPENSNRCRDFTTREAAFEKCESLDGDFVKGLQAAAAELKIIVVAGVDMKGEQSPNCTIGQVLIDADGKLLHVHHKTVLWDYEYTLFVPGTKQLEATQTDIGKIGMLMCADGIVPEVPRVLALKGADILCNSLNSRGPDEMRIHEPLRAIENHVWHIASNTVGGPEDAYPWTGGSQIISPLGDILAWCGETEKKLVWADITPYTSFPKALGGGIGSLNDFRRPDLYAELRAEKSTHVVKYGPIPENSPKVSLHVATLQLSWYHSRQWTIVRALGQIKYSASRGTQLGVFPELFCFKPGEVDADPVAAAKLSSEVLAKIQDATATASSMYVAINLVETEGSEFYSTLYLLDIKGEIIGKYRKVHLGEMERKWATPGTTFEVINTPIGAIGLMLGNEIWLPEMARILSLRGADVIVHPTSWDRIEAATCAAVERTEENRTHLISCSRTDNVAVFGSQIVIADRFRFGQCIALMRYPTAVWSRTGFEENIFLELDLMDSRNKMQGFHLDPLGTRQPNLYDVMVQ